jgi:bifunctional enzyme CysN/CysC
MVCWTTDDRPLTPRTKLVIKHTTRTARAMVKDLNYRLNVNTLHRDEAAQSLTLNEIGRVSLRVTHAVVRRRLQA